MIHTQLCQLLSDWRGDVAEGGAWIERKRDGWRALRFPGLDGKARLWTRNGLPIEGVGHILWRLDQIERAAGQPMFFDGEFVVGSSLSETKAWAEKGWKGGGEAGVLHLFDALPLGEWQAGGGDTPLYERKARLRALVAAAEVDAWEWRPGSRGRDEGATPVVLMEDGWAETEADVIDAAKRIWAIGGEGIILKDAEAPYRRNRNGAWAKIKRENMHHWRKAA